MKKSKPFYALAKCGLVATLLLAWVAPAHANTATCNVNAEGLLVCNIDVTDGNGVDLTFTLVEETTVTFTTHTSLTCPTHDPESIYGDPYLYIFDDQDNVIAEDDDSAPFNDGLDNFCWDSYIETTLQAGEYRLNVNVYENYYGVFTLDVGGVTVEEPVEEQPEPTPTPEPTPEPTPTPTPEPTPEPTPTPTPEPVEPTPTPIPTPSPTPTPVLPDPTPPPPPPPPPVVIIEPEPPTITEEIIYEDIEYEIDYEELDLSEWETEELEELEDLELEDLEELEVLEFEELEETEEEPITDNEESEEPEEEEQAETLEELFTEEELEELDEQEIELLEELIQEELDDEIIEELEEILDEEEITEEEIEAITENEQYEDLPTAARQQIVQVVNEAPVEVREQFEENVNVFDSEDYADYVQVGSRITTEDRKTVIAITAAASAMSSSIRPTATTSAGPSTPSRRVRHD